MSNERSPRASCWITTGTRGMLISLRNPWVARFPSWYYAQPMSCVTREIVLPVPRERAWELVTEPAELREWLADDVKLEAEEGPPLRAEDRDGVVEVVDDEDRILFRCREPRVVWPRPGPP